MPTFDPNFPPTNAEVLSAPFRDNFNALKTLIDDIPTGPQSPGGTAGGDLGGNYPNPTIQSIANITTGPAVYPAGSAQNLTSVPAPQNLMSGSNTVLDAFGAHTLMLPYAVTSVVACWGQPGGVGMLSVNQMSPTVIAVQSNAGGTDSGANFNWIAF